jgi:hypothetical protein
MKPFVTTICWLVFAGRLMAQAPQVPAHPTPDDVLFSPVDLANDKVKIAKSIGPLFENLVAAFSLDRPYGGSLEYVRYGTWNTGAHIAGTIQWLTDSGRQCADFSHQDAAIVTPGGAPGIGQNYTLAVWMKFPLPTATTIVWTGSPQLSIESGVLLLGLRPKIQTLGTLLPVPNGWHHLVLICDGRQTLVYLDGVQKGMAPVAQDCRVASIGGSPAGSPGYGQCGLLDDMLIFDRALTPTEIATLGPFRLPVHPPEPGELDLVEEGLRSSPSNVDFSIKPSQPASQEVATAVANLIKTYRGSLVFATSQADAGSGFLATYAKGNFLFTNTHVAAGARGSPFKTLDGGKVSISGASSAVGHDIFLLQTTSTARPFEIMTEVDQQAAIGDDIVVLDNLEGVGPVDPIMGKIVGVGPNIVEVDAPFVTGNSGSPIVHVKSGKVIGVAAYLTVKKFDPSTKDLLATPEIRRFGYRLDSVKSWQPVNWATFWAQAQEMEAIEKLTTELVKFVSDVRKNHKLSPGLQTNPIIKAHLDAYEAQTKGRLSGRDAATALTNLFAYLKTTCRTDVLAAQQHFTYDFFRRKLADEQRDREVLADIFEKTIKEIH